MILIQVGLEYTRENLATYTDAYKAVLAAYEKIKLENENYWELYDQDELNTRIELEKTLYKKAQSIYWWLFGDSGESEGYGQISQNSGDYLIPTNLTFKESISLCTEWLAAGFFGGSIDMPAKIVSEAYDQLSKLTSTFGVSGEELSQWLHDESEGIKKNLIVENKIRKHIEDAYGDKMTDTERLLGEAVITIAGFLGGACSGKVIGSLKSLIIGEDYLGQRAKVTEMVDSVLKAYSIIDGCDDVMDTAQDTYNETGSTKESILNGLKSFIKNMVSYLIDERI